MPSDTDGDDEERVNPRTRRVRDVVLAAAVEVLIERGAHEVTAARVAEQADVARTTIYRHWPDQRSLLLATIDRLTAPHHRFDSVGPLDDDVRSTLGHLRTRLTTHDVHSVYGALAARAAHDDGFRDAQRRFVQQLERPMRDVLEAAQQRGSLPAEVNCEREARLLTAPVLHQHLSLHERITDEFLDEVVSRWLTARGGR